MWSRLTVVVRHEFHWQVRLRLFVLLRPTWRSQMCSCRVIELVSMHNTTSRVYSFIAKKGSPELENDMLLYYYKRNHSFLPLSRHDPGLFVVAHTYIEYLCIAKLLVALVPAADECSGSVHRVAERRRDLGAGRRAAAIVAGAGIGGCAVAAIGAGG
jgi:hypothetical protein